MVAAPFNSSVQRLLVGMVGVGNMGAGALDRHSTTCRRCAQRPPLWLLASQYCWLAQPTGLKSKAFRVAVNLSPPFPCAAMATRLLGAGYRLIVCDRNEEAVNRLQASLLILPCLSLGCQPRGVCILARLEGAPWKSMQPCLRPGSAGTVVLQPMMRDPAPAWLFAGRWCQGSRDPGCAGLHPRPLCHHLHAALLGARAAGGRPPAAAHRGHVCLCA